jgi:hypothetical protein
MHEAWFSSKYRWSETATLHFLGVSCILAVQYTHFHQKLNALMVVKVVVLLTNPLATKNSRERSHVSRLTITRHGALESISRPFFIPLYVSSYNVCSFNHLG